MAENRHDESIKLFTHFVRSAAHAYGVKRHPPKLLNGRLTWNVESFTVMLNVETDDVYVSGASWTMVIKADESYEMEGSLREDNVAVGPRELLALIVASCVTEK